MNLRQCHEQVEHLKMDTNVGNNFEFQQIGNRTTTTTVIITFPSQEGICCFTNNHFQKKLSHSYWELCLLASSTSPPSPCAHTASHHFMGFLCSRHAWQVNLNRFTVLSPPYITGSVLAHSDSHPVSVSLFFFSASTLTLVCSADAFTCLLQLPASQIRLRQTVLGI